MFGFGKGLGKRRGRKKCHGQHNCTCHDSLHLADAEVGKKYIILNNPDIKTMEMGIYRGGVITVHKSEEDSQNIVVGVGDSRFIIPRELAANIHIK